MLKPRVEVRNDGGILVAEFWDCLRLDPAPVQELRKEFETHLRHKGHPDLVIDLNGVTFAGSAALGGFLALNRQARQHDGRMVFCNVDPTVFEVFRVSKLVPLFNFEPDMAAAMALLKGQGPGAAPPAPAGPLGEPPGDGKKTNPSADAPLRRGRRPSG